MRNFAGCGLMWSRTLKRGNEMTTVLAEKDTKPTSFLDNFSGSRARCKDVLVYMLPDETTIEDVVREVMTRNGITGIYLVPQSLYQTGRSPFLSRPDIYEIPVSRPIVLENKTFDEIRKELNYEVINFANLVYVGNQQRWIPNVDITTGARRLPINIIAQELVRNMGLGEGILVDTGAGLHFWGLNTVEERTWREIHHRIHERRSRPEFLIDNQWVFQLSRYSYGPYSLRVTDWPINKKPTPKPLYYLKRR